MANVTVTIGKVDVYFPEIDNKDYWIYEDFAELFSTETTVEAVRLLKKEIKQAGIKGRIIIDDEADGASISTRKGETMLAVVLLINQLIDVSFSHDEQVLQEIKDRMKKHKVPKAQSFEIGNILAIPLRNNQYGPAQLIEINQNYGLVCLFFDGAYASIEEMKREMKLTRENVFAGATFSDTSVLNYSFQVVDREREIIGKVIHNGRRNRLVEEILADVSVIELLEDRINGTVNEELEYNMRKLKYIEWL